MRRSGCCHASRKRLTRRRSGTRGGVFLYLRYYHGMKRFVTIDKRVGQTPLAAIEAWRQAHPAYADIPASYAGRLDPMASGKLLVLFGDECKRQERYTALDKEYEIEVLLDIATDTGDVLGVPSYTGTSWTGDVGGALRAMRGTHRVPYPAFSSKTVAGKPLFLYALEGTLGTIDTPRHDETIYRIELLGRTEVSTCALLERIQRLLSHVPRSEEPSKRLGADFRQDAIRAAWQEVFSTIPDRPFTVLRLRVACASGTYMRTLAGRIGMELGSSGIALSIHRTRIGRYLPYLRAWLPIG